MEPSPETHTPAMPLLLLTFTAFDWWPKISSASDRSGPKSIAKAFSSRASQRRSRSLWVATEGLDHPCLPKSMPPSKVPWSLHRHPLERSLFMFVVCLHRIPTSTSLIIVLWLDGVVRARVQSNNMATSGAHHTSLLERYSLSPCGPSIHDALHSWSDH